MPVKIAEVASSASGGEGRIRRRRRRVVAAGLAVAVAGSALGLWATGGFSNRPASGAASPAAISMATVTRQSLTSQAQVNATLGYGGSYDVVLPSAVGDASTGASQPGSAGAVHGGEQPAATFTALPSVSQVVSQGQRLYALDQSPTVLLYGSVPAYRTLAQGMTGADVRQLNADLVALGDATDSQLDPRSDYFSAATAAALVKLQASLGMAKTGELPLSEAAFMPTAVRVTSISATLGGTAQPGADVLQATSTTRAVIAQLDAAQQAEVKVGDKVTITLPDHQTTPGVVSTVGTVATTSGAESGGGQGSPGSGSSGSPSGSAAVTPTVQVDITPTDPAATGTLDQAPVTVTITTATVTDALVVPVDALLAEARGGYAVEVAGAAGGRRLVPVKLGLFDDANGLVQVTASGLSAGSQIVVPEL